MNRINRKAFVLLVVVLLSFLMLLPTYADGLDYVTDTYGMLSQEQWERLESKASQISDKYNLGVYIIVVDDYGRYSDGSDVWEAAASIYNQYSLGYGADHNGALLMLSMSDRDYALHFYGSDADYTFTEAGRDRMIDSFLPYFKRNDYYGGLNDYLNTCERYLEAARNGTPVGYGERSTADELDEEGVGLFAAIPGAIAAALTGLFMSSSMHSASAKQDADQYAVRGSLQLTRRSDMFLHRSVTRVPRQTQSSSSGSRSSVHHSSGGHSGRSGKF